MKDQTLMNTLTEGVSFLGAPVQADPWQIDADFAFLGIPYGVPYTLGDVSPPAAAAPSAIRRCSQARGLGHDEYLERFDFDLGRPLAAGTPVRIVDCGDVPGDLYDIAGNEARATAAVRGILAGGAVPLVVGGDHSIPPFVVAAFEGRGPIDVLQIDAHLDYRDEWRGVRGGYSSPMYRLREMPWVRDIVQVGLRAIGSARQQEVDAAIAAGNVLVDAYQVHEKGIGCVVDRFRGDGAIYVTLDIDGLDPTIAPGTDPLVTVPGGLTFPQVIGILRGLAAKGELAGMDICEFCPDLDIQQLTAATITRTLVNFIGLAQRA